MKSKKILWYYSRLFITLTLYIFLYAWLKIDSFQLPTCLKHLRIRRNKRERKNTSFRYLSDKRFISWIENFYCWARKYIGPSTKFNWTMNQKLNRKPDFQPIREWNTHAQARNDLEKRTGIHNILWTPSSQIDVKSCHHQIIVISEFVFSGCIFIPPNYFEMLMLKCEEKAT